MFSGIVPHFFSNTHHRKHVSPPPLSRSMLLLRLLLRYHDTIERYCDETDVWEIVGEMPTSRSWLSCVSLPLRRDSHNDDCMELSDTMVLN